MGLVRSEPLPDAAVPLVLLAVVPPDAPRYAERFPNNRVRATRDGGDHSAVEHHERARPNPQAQKDGNGRAQ